MRPNVHTVHVRQLAAWLCTAALLGACSDSTGPTGKGSLNVSTLVQEASLGSVSGVAVMFAGGIPVSSSIQGIPACAYNASMQRFDCPTHSVNGLSMTVTYTLLNAAGQPVSVPDPKVVEAIHIVTDMTGTLAAAPGGGFGTMSMTRHDDNVLSGLLSGRHVLNGTASSSNSMTRLTGGTFSSTSHDTRTNILLPVAGSGVTWPTGGTMSSEITVDSGLLAAFTSQVTMVFSPSGVATMTIANGSYTSTCQINLSNPGALSGITCR